jgi:hypothetical protein
MENLSEIKQLLKSESTYDIAIQILKGYVESTIRPEIIEPFRLVNDRICKARELDFSVSNKPIGTGGVGTVKYFSKLDEIRIQIGYAKGTGMNGNYADCIIL